jgi:hypothetical protein
LSGRKEQSRAEKIAAGDGGVHAQRGVAELVVAGLVLASINVEIDP